MCKMTFLYEYQSTLYSVDFHRQKWAGISSFPAFIVQEIGMESKTFSSIKDDEGKYEQSIAPVAYVPISISVYWVLSVFFIF